MVVMSFLCDSPTQLSLVYIHAIVATVTIVPIVPIVTVEAIVEIVSIAAVVAIVAIVGNGGNKFPLRLTNTVVSCVTTVSCL